MSQPKRQPVDGLARLLSGINKYDLALAWVAHLTAEPPPFGGDSLELEDAGEYIRERALHMRRMRHERPSTVVAEHSVTYTEELPLPMAGGAIDITARRADEAVRKNLAQMRARQIRDRLRSTDLVYGSYSIEPRDEDGDGTWGQIAIEIAGLSKRASKQRDARCRDMATALRRLGYRSRFVTHEVTFGGTVKTYISYLLIDTNTLPAAT